MNAREAVIERRTKETDIRCYLVVDGVGVAQIDTGLGFLDHLLTALTRFARFDLELRCRGDLHIDDHHTSEDCALALGAALDKALGERAGIARFGHAYAPLDEALARAVVDFSGRPFAVIDMGLKRDTLGRLDEQGAGQMATENVPHVLHSLATAARLTLHVDVLRGDNDHHRAEAAFKAVGLAIRQAMALDGEDIPSTKGVLV
ncbi:MAG: imidazoleglycerol-phosphate dehydratase HisB [Candidatus Lernaella stagnicola]|nr:imidazoleglycerol-phosphate dehydratase HisB [Candidatus Lernaella stagnicola]